MQRLINQIHNVCAFELLAQIPNASIDCIITDPPYYKVLDIWWANLWDSEEVYYEWILKLLAEWHRVLKPNGLLCHSNTFGHISDKVLDLSISVFENCDRVTWRKPDIWFRAEDYFFCRMPLNKTAIPSQLIFNPEKKKSNRHICEKPSKLMEYLIETLTQKDDLILDSFMGSGSLAVAAKLLRRNFIGSEIDPIWAKSGQEALKKITNLDIEAKELAIRFKRK